jgi:hypothetical protein
MNKDRCLTIFVNTSDNFEDCWIPFFKLFETYWKDCPYPIVLNTETKDFSYPNLDITCTKVSAGEQERQSWSVCLARALDSIKTPYILYLQEDYFLESPPRVDELGRMIEIMKERNPAVIYLTRGVIGPWIGSDQDIVWSVVKNAKWRLSLQAGIWNKEILRSLIRAHETPWQLESYGSWRTKKIKHEFLCVNRKKYIGNGQEIFPYEPTGIVAGKWVRQIVEPLFKKHGISIDFSLRGFHDPKDRKKKRKSFFKRVLDRIRSLF